MNLTDVELQRKTGCPVVRGRLSIGSEADMAVLGIPRHDRLLLSFESAPAVLGIIPTTDVTHDEYGFCNTTLADHGLGFTDWAPTK